jgi:carbon storage regulator
MLVLTRRVGERLRIGPDIEVVVLEVRGREARLGITAPAAVPIHREEIYLKLQEAARVAGGDTAAQRPVDRTRRREAAPTE